MSANSDIITTQAWVLPAGPAPAELILKDFSFPYDPKREVLLETVFGCWEANMSHALERQPIDICHLRRESEVVMGNGGVVRVLDSGPTQIPPGTLCLVLAQGPLESDLSYSRLAHAYDAPASVGLLAQRNKCLPHQVLPLPEGLSQADLARWAGFALRFITAWGNWVLTHGTYLLLNPRFAALLQGKRDPVFPPGPDSEAEQPWVLAWGGGVAYAEILLAQAAGYRVGMFTSRPARARLLRSQGIAALERPTDLNAALLKDPATVERYRGAEASFLSQIQALTPRGAAIFIDLIGEPVFKATLKALDWPGIITTAGWKEGMRIQYQRALACMGCQQLLHTHYARTDQAQDALNYALEHDWLPPRPERIWGWNEIPALAAAFDQGMDDYFPVYAVSRI